MVGLTNAFDSQTPYYQGVILSGAFKFGAWQLLFVVGAWFGHCWQDGKVGFESLRPALLALLVDAALLLFGARHGLVPLPLPGVAARLGQLRKEGAWPLASRHSISRGGEASRAAKLKVYRDTGSGFAPGEVGLGTDRTA